MRTTLELEDIQAIAEKMVEIMLPLFNKSQEQKDSILSIDEASGLLGKSKGQIYQWVSDSRHGLNTFPYLKAGKSLRFSKTAIIQSIDSSKLCFGVTILPRPLRERAG